MQEFILKLNFSQENNIKGRLDMNPEDHFLDSRNLNFFSKDENSFSYSCFTNYLSEEVLDYQDSEYLVVSSLSDEAINSLKNLKPELRAIKNPSELVLKFYLSCPLDFFGKITGGFCFIVFKKEQKEIFCIRDQYGLKNLFFSINDNEAYFSTRLSFLVSQKNISKTINIQTLADFLELSKNCKFSTFFNEISKIPNACFLSKKNSKYQISQYDQIEVKKNYSNFIETSRGLRKIFEKTLNRKVINHKKVGVMFSGGLDSSCVLAMLSNEKKDLEISAISSVFKEVDPKISKKTDESDFQNKLLINKEVNHYKFEGSNFSTLKEIDQYLKIIGEPFFFPNAYIPFNCFKIAKNKNINLVLNGNDGDTVISHGYELLVELFFNFKWISLYKEFANISRVNKVNKNYIFRRIIIGRFFSQMLIFIFFWIKKIFSLNQNLLINNSFSRESKFFQRNKPNFPFISAARNHLKILNQNLQFEAIEKQGAMASYIGVSESYPFYDIEFIKYCLSINPKFKLMNGMQRFILRDSMKDLLPKKIFQRTSKSQLSYILQNDFLNENKSFITKNIENPNEFLLKRINFERLLKVWEKIKSNKSNINSSDLSVIFAYVVVNHWLNKEIHLTK